MRIDYAIPAKYVEINDNLATIIGGGIESLEVSELPELVAVMFAVRIVGKPSELHGQHRLRILVRDAQGETVEYEAGNEIEIEIGQVTPSSDDWVQALMIEAHLQFEASTLGAHVITISFDHVEIAVPMVVREISAQ